MITTPRKLTSMATDVKHPIVSPIMQKAHKEAQKGTVAPIVCWKTSGTSAIPNVMAVLPATPVQERAKSVQRISLATVKLCLEQRATVMAKRVEMILR